MAQVRVALFFTTLDLGGTEQQARLLIRNIDRKRFPLTVYAMRGGSLENELKQLGITVKILHSTKATAFRDISKLRKWLREDKIDVLQCLLWHSNMLGRFACIGTKTKCINSVRWAERIPSRDAIDYSTRFLVNAWIANSEHGANLARLPKAKTTIIHNGLNKELLNTPLSSWKPKPKTAIMVGQFRREKRYDVLIRAAALMPDWKFSLVGEGPFLEHYRKLAKHLEVKNVMFLGHRADVKQLMLRSEAALLLSNSEGTPNTTLEAMALGVPFIGSDIVAHRVLLGNERGVLVQNEPEAIARALKMLHARDKKAVLANRKAMRTYVQKKYAIPKMVAATQEVWLKMTRK